MVRVVCTMAAAVLAVMALALLLGCSPEPPTPTRTPFPTRAEPADEAHQVLTEALSELEYDLGQARSLMAFLAKAPQVTGESESECEAFLEQQLKNNSQYSQLGVTTPNGVLYCDTTGRDRDFSVADRLYFSRALTEHDFVVGEFVIGRVTLTPSLGMAYPILDDADSVSGVVIAPLRLSWLAQRFANINIPVTAEIVVIDSYGNLLLRDPDATDWFGKNISDTELGAAMLDRVQGSGEFAGADGEVRQYSFASPLASGGRVIVAVGVAER